MKSRRQFPNPVVCAGFEPTEIAFGAVKNAGWTQKGTQRFAPALPRDLLIESETGLPRGTRELSDSPGRSHVRRVSNAESGASDLALQEVSDAWPRLNREQRAAVLAVVRAILAPAKTT